MIAMSQKSYREGDFIKQYLIKTLEIVYPEKVDFFKNISLTRNTFAEWIDEISDELKQHLKVVSSRFECGTNETIDITGIDTACNLYLGW